LTGKENVWAKIHVTNKITDDVRSSSYSNCNVYLKT
jgi:hypothetical protein